MNVPRRFGPPRSLNGFTLIELVVVLFIVSILASLSLAGLAGARQRAKIDKTKSTIRKIHELVVPHYESYVRRRVPANVLGPPSNPLQAATNRLIAIRTLALYEMPDSWRDVATSETASVLNPSGNIPAYAFTDRSRVYGAFYAAIGAPTAQHRSAECLYMIVSRGLGEPDVMEQFRADEIGNTDSDGAPEFLDGWGRPISFMRWPTGFVSPDSLIQVPDPLNRHDPFDPVRLEANAFALTPMIYSAGPDGEDGLVQLEGWTGENLAIIFSVTSSSEPYAKPGAPNPSSAAARDNITNHDLGAR